MTYAFAAAVQTCIIISRLQTSRCSICRLPSTCKETSYCYLPAAASGGGGGATPACVPRCVVALTARTSSRRSSTLSWSLGVRRSSVSLVLVRVIICTLRRSDGSLVVCQDTDSHYSLIREHRARPGAGISDI